VEGRFDVCRVTLAAQVVDKLDQTLLIELGRELLQLFGKLEDAVQDQAGGSNSALILYEK
jgi:hypothetical protein